VFEVKIENDYKNIEIHAKYAVFRNFKGKYALTSAEYKVKRDDKKDHC